MPGQSARTDQKAVFYFELTDSASLIKNWKFKCSGALSPFASNA